MFSITIVQFTLENNLLILITLFFLYTLSFKITISNNHSFYAFIHF